MGRDGAVGGFSCKLFSLLLRPSALGKISVTVCYGSCGTVWNAAVSCEERGFTIKVDAAEQITSSIGEKINLKLPMCKEFKPLHPRQPISASFLKEKTLQWLNWGDRYVCVFKAKLRFNFTKCFLGDKMSLQEPFSTRRELWWIWMSGDWKIGNPGMM